METKHTKGEWINGYGNGLSGPTTPNISNPTVDEKRKYIPISKDEQTIAIVIQPENNSINEMKANAKLIAAAPDMLEALNDLMNSISGGEKICGHNYYCVCPYDRAKDAIKKATE